MSDSCPLTYIVVLTYNGKRFLEPCFRSLLATDYSNARFLLIDNASTEDLASYVKERFPAVQTLRLDANVGPARAANLGINYAIERGAVYVAVCHDDVVMVAPRWLDHAVHHLQKDPRVGIAWFQETHPLDEIPVMQQVRLRSVQYPFGCALVMRASLVQNIGAYDTIYHAGSDDDDLVARALKAGYRVGEFNIPVVHHGSGTYGRRDVRTAYYHMRNSLRFYVKHRGPLRWLLRIVRMLDVSCNPWPLTFDSKDSCHERWRNRGNVLLNAVLCTCAIGWNILRLPQTLFIRARESRLIRQTRQRLQQDAHAFQCAVSVQAWPRKHNLCGVFISATDYDGVVEQLIAAAHRRESAVASFFAVHAVITAAGDAELREKVNRFAIIAPDGQPVRWALNRLYKARLRDRVYGPELMLRLCEKAAEEELPIYLYGGANEEILARLQENLRRKFPGLQIAGAESPPFRPLRPEEDAAMVRRVNESGARFLFIGLGCPKQDRFAADHAGRIQAVQLCVGAAFDFHAGRTKMAPRLMQRHGLEWLYRLWREPRRLWKRYLVTNSIFMAAVCRQWLCSWFRA